MGKAWKAFEIRVSRSVGRERRGPAGARLDDAKDHPGLWVECKMLKLRLGSRSLVRLWRGAEKNRAASVREEDRSKETVLAYKPNATGSPDGYVGSTVGVGRRPFLEAMGVPSEPLPGGELGVFRWFQDFAPRALERWPAAGGVRVFRLPAR